MLPWVAMVDEFQHWLYTHEGHSAEERNQAWLDISEKYDTGMVDYLIKFREIRWQSQLHIYEVPFYYIEYGISQLGALAMFQNFRKNPEKAMKNYVDFMKLGYTKSISEIYKTAGIRFDFSLDYVQNLVEFVEAEVGG
jgi:oligoendopeptidase F